MPWTAACQASLTITNSWSLLKFMFIELVMPSNYFIPFSSCVQNFPASGSFPMSQFLASGDQNIGVSASASVLPMNTGLISFRIDWFDSQVFSSTTIQKHEFFSLLYGPSSYLYMTTGKTIALTIYTFVGKVMPLLFNMKLKVSFNFMAVVIIRSDFRAQEKKICHCFHFFPFYLPWSDGTRCHDLSFFNVEF